MTGLAAYRERVQTHDQARVALGAAATMLGRGYAELGNVPSGKLRDSSRRLLDTTMTGVRSTLARYRPGGGKLGSDERLFVARSLVSVNTALSVVDDNGRSTLAEDFARALLTVLRTVPELPRGAVKLAAGVVEEASQGAAAAVGNVVGRLWWVLVLAGVGAAVYLKVMVKR